MTSAARLADSQPAAGCHPRMPFCPTASVFTTFDGPQYQYFVCFVHSESGYWRWRMSKACLENALLDLSVIP